MTLFGKLDQPEKLVETNTSSFCSTGSYEEKVTLVTKYFFMTLFNFSGLLDAWLVPVRLFHPSLVFSVKAWQTQVEHIMVLPSICSFLAFATNIRKPQFTTLLGWSVSLFHPSLTFDILSQLHQPICAMRKRHQHRESGTKDDVKF